MSFYTPAPMNTTVHNQYGVQTGSIVGGRMLDRNGYDTGFRLQSDWTFNTREGYRTAFSVDPVTGRISSR